MTQRRAGDIHCGIAHAQHRHPLAQFIGIGVNEVIQPEMYIAKALAGNAEIARLPDARAHKDGSVTIAQ